jgi:large subunit ribosomal protein L24e
MKTETCSFSAYKVYPGHGIRYVRTDNRILFFRDSKCRRLFLHKHKPAQFRWTAVYRKMHKSKKSLIARKKVRKVAKIQRAVAGTSVAAIQKKRTQKPEERQAAREAALAEVKKRREATKDARAERKAKQHSGFSFKAAPGAQQKGTAPKGR